MVLEEIERGINLTVTDAIRDICIVDRWIKKFTKIVVMVAIRDYLLFNYNSRYKMYYSIVSWL